MNIESFEDVVRYLDGTYSPSVMPSIKDNRTYRLEREREILKLLHNPEKELTCIHVAGSKGKGTTAAYLASLIGGGNAKVGLYMSPHVYNYRERWMLSSLDKKKPISFFTDKEYIQAANIMQSFLGDHKKLKLKDGLSPTQFELYTAYAFVLFRYAKINVAVIETGLGGRLDATNVINSIACVLTHIEKEHTDILGNDIKDITREKCGIIKNGVSVFALKGSAETDEVIKSECKKKKAELFFIENRHDDNLLPLKIKGDNAYTDFNLALSVVKHLNINCSEKAKARACSLTLPARSEVTIEKDKIVILDGAHTVCSIQELCKNTGIIAQNIRPEEIINKQINPEMSKEINIQTFAYDMPFIDTYPRAVIFSCLENKDSFGMLEILIKEFDIIALTSIDGYKKSNMNKIVLDAEKVLNKTKNRRVKKIIINDDIEECLNEITSTDYSYMFNKNIKIIVVTGSFYLCSSFFGG